MKNLIFHVGTPKTGTTFIQNAFANNRDVLENQRIAYHKISDSLSVCHWWFAAIFFDDPMDYAPVKNFVIENDLERLEDIEQKSIRALRAEVKNYDTVILSAEQYFFLPELVLERIRDFFLSIDVVVSIRIYVREPVELAISEMNQKIKFGLANFETFSKNLPNFHIKRNITKYIKVFGKDKISVTNYSNLPKHDLLASVSNSIDVKNFKIKLGGKATNKSLSREGLEIMDVFNKCYPHEGVNSNFRRDLLNLLLSSDGTEFFPSHDLVRKLSADFVSDSIFLKDEFGIEFDNTIDSIEGG